MKSDASECSFCGDSEANGARLWRGDRRAPAATAVICQECVSVAGEVEVVSPPARFSFDGHELEWIAVKATLPVLAVTVAAAGSSHGEWLPFGVAERPTDEMAREVATKLRHLLIPNRR